MPSGERGRVTTVLFDLDDTLLDSYRARIQALQDLFDRRNITGLNAEKLLASLKGAPFQDTLKSMAEERGIAGDLFHQYRRIYWVEQLNNLRLYPGVRAMLATLKSRGYKLGVVTSKLRDAEFEGGRIGCTYELRKIGISNIFSVIIGLEDVKRHKPYPDGIDLALERMGSQPEETLFVGDSAADIEAAHNAGCRSCHATWNAMENGLPPGLKPDYTVKAPRELVALDCL